MAANTATKFIDYYQRYEYFRQHQETSNKLVEDLLVYVQNIETDLRKLKGELQDARLDLDHATASRRELQTLLRNAEKKVSSTEMTNDALKNRNPYLLILIDGDGLIFKEKWIKQGLEGGKKAAAALHAAISQYCGEMQHEMEFITKVYANLGGLAKAMQRNGCLENASLLREFALGFTQFRASFDFIDVGYGKERADSKIREITQWNIANHNCKHVLLGISHDSGYAPFLDELLSSEMRRKQISILEGSPTVRELRATNASVIKLSNDLFRDDKLVVRTSQPPPLVSSPIQSKTASPATSIASASPIMSSSYASITGKASPPPQMVLPLGPRPNPPGRQRSNPTPWNPGPRGLDATINVPMATLETIKKRKDSNKLCNNHYLRGPCSKGDDCCFEHKYKPTKDEILAIALLSRLNPCTNGQDCDVEDCIYGHHCPSVKDGVCLHPFCKFPIDKHPPGTKFKNPNIHANF